MFVFLWLIVPNFEHLTSSPASKPHWKRTQLWEPKILVVTAIFDFLNNLSLVCVHLTIYFFLLLKKKESNIAAASYFKWVNIPSPNFAIGKWLLPITDVIGVLIVEDPIARAFSSSYFFFSSSYVFLLASSLILSFSSSFFFNFSSSSLLVASYWAFFTLNFIVSFEIISFPFTSSFELLNKFISCILLFPKNIFFFLSPLPLFSSLCVNSFRELYLFYNSSSCHNALAYV